jgi:hypothetical protein
VGVLLWVVGKQFLVKHVMASMLHTLVTDPSLVPLDGVVRINSYLHYLFWVEFPCVKGV